MERFFLLFPMVSFSLFSTSCSKEAVFIVNNDEVAPEIDPDEPLQEQPECRASLYIKPLHLPPSRLHFSQRSIHSNLLKGIWIIPINLNL